MYKPLCSTCCSYRRVCCGPCRSLHIVTSTHHVPSLVPIATAASLPFPFPFSFSFFSRNNDLPPATPTPVHIYAKTHNLRYVQKYTDSNHTHNPTRSIQHFMNTAAPKHTAQRPLQGQPPRKRNPLSNPPSSPLRKQQADRKTPSQSYSTAPPSLADLQLSMYMQLSRALPGETLPTLTRSSRVGGLRLYLSFFLFLFCFLSFLFV